MTAATTTNPDVVNALAEDFLERYRRGERPSVSEYVKGFPAVADQVADVIQVLLLMENLGADQGCNESQVHDPAPERLGDYQIVREIGRGGMGVVYEAVQNELGRHVALKVLPSSAHLKPTHLLRFRREAQAAARLHHTNIVPVFGVGVDGGTHFYAMQYIHGQGLDVVLKQVRGQRDAGRATSTVEAALAPSTLSGLSSAVEYARAVARVGMQIADALEHAHAAGVLHRDVKPSNILLDADGRAWLSDFGLAHCDSDDGLTATGEVVGTFRYMAAERFQRQGDARSDIYALGLTLYELLTLHPAFPEPDRAKLIHQIMKQEPLPPRRIDPGIPRDLETIVLKAITKEPEHRYQKAQDLAADLSRFLTDRPVGARRLRWWERSWRWTRRNAAVSVAALCTFLALTAGLALTLWQWQRAEGLAVSEQAATRQANQLRGEAEANATLAWEAFTRMVRALNGSIDQTPEEMKRDILQQALTLHEEYLNRVNDPPSQFEKGRIAATLGRLWQRTKADDIAEKQLHVAIDTFDALLNQGYRPGEMRLELSIALSDVALLLQRRHKLKEADTSSARSVDLAREMFAAQPNARQARYVLAWSLHTRATIAKQLGERWEPFLREAIMHAESLCAVAKPPILDMEAHAEFRKTNAEWLLQGQQPGDALHHAQAAVKIAERVASDFPMLPKAQDQLRQCLEVLGDTHVRRREYRDAESVYRRVALQQRVKFEQSPSDPLRNRSLAYALHCLTMTLREQRKIKEALPLIEEAIQRERAALVLRPQDVQSQQMLTRYYKMWASLRLLDGNPEGSIEVVTQMSALPRFAAQDHFDVAFHLCQCAESALKQDGRSEEERRKLAKSCHDLVVHELRKGVAQGFRDTRQLKNPAFNPLRHREDFRQVLADMTHPVNEKR